MCACRWRSRNLAYCCFKVLMSKARRSRSLLGAIACSAPIVCGIRSTKEFHHIKRYNEFRINKIITTLNTYNTISNPLPFFNRCAMLNIAAATANLSSSSVSLSSSSLSFLAHGVILYLCFSLSPVTPCKGPMLTIFCTNNVQNRSLKYTTARWSLHGDTSVR